MIVKLIQTLHLVLVIILACSVFIPNRKIKEMALTLLIYILFQYVTNYGKCGLTQMEYLVMGEQYNEGFLYRLIKPIITVPEEYFEKHLFWIHIIYIFILAYQLYVL